MKQYRIGLMVGNKSIDYVYAIRMGVQNTLEEAGHTLIAISDLIPFHSRINAISYFRVAFEVASRLGLDAIIVPAGSIASYLQSDCDELEKFIDILDHSRTLVIERNMPGYRCVQKDSAPGMHACMRHLIEDCGFKKIAFIGGPESSKGAREREDIYFQEMRDHGLDTPPSLLAHGEFSGECGDAIDRLIDENEGLEAIACSCDLIAQSVYRVMRRRRLSVGTDIAVTGFDDQAIAEHLDPPLTTVHMTGYDLGCMAAREALRLCEGKPQEEPVLSSSLCVRASCGEETHTLVKQFQDLLTMRPLPADKITDLLVKKTVITAGKRDTEDFREAMRSFVLDVRASYLRHRESESMEDPIFSPQKLNDLFRRPYRQHLSLDGFQAGGIAVLQALIEMSNGADADWAIQQISNFHLSIARMLNMEVQEAKIETSKREWTAFHVIDDVVREYNDPNDAYCLVLRDLKELGVRRADLYLLPEPVVFIGARTFALSDTLQPIGSLCGDEYKTFDSASVVTLQNVLDRVVSQNDDATTYTVGGIMAGNELVGIAAMDCGTLDEDGQLIAFLNLGIALKHMQMLANERESNELLSKNNLLLERQSHYDEMTGALNRRGFMGKVKRMLEMHLGEMGALFYLDLDGLKVINDTYGHDYGDEAIRQATRVLGVCFPPDAILGRLGGDEFVVFALIRDEHDIASLEKSVDASMATFNATHSYPFDLAISYGGVPISIDESTFDSITEEMVQADERLYEMKKRRGSRSARKEA